MKTSMFSFVGDNFLGYLEWMKNGRILSWMKKNLVTKYGGKLYMSNNTSQVE